MTYVATRTQSSGSANIITSPQHSEAQTQRQGQASNETTVVREWNETLLHAIRNDLARPTIHARNLHHWSMACYDAWAAYDSVATPFLVNAEIPYIEDDASRRWAQETAINYASYRLLWNRFLDSPGGTSTLMTLCLLYTSPSPRDAHESRMPSSA